MQGHGGLWGSCLVWEDVGRGKAPWAHRGAVTLPAAPLPTGPPPLHSPSRAASSLIALSFGCLRS